LKPKIIVLEVCPRLDPIKDPIAWVMVERKEVFKRGKDNGILYEASICLTYRRIVSSSSKGKEGKGSFEGSYSENSDMVSLSSPSISQSGAVFFDLPDLKGQRIGTYLMNEIVQWVQRWPSAKVRSIELLDGQAEDDNKKRRKLFYEQFGLKFKYTDQSEKEGISEDIPVGELHTTETWKDNIKEIELPDFLSKLLDEKESLSTELERIQKSRDCWKSKYENAEKSPVIWAIKQLFDHCAPAIGLLFIAFMLLMTFLHFYNM
jgi:GNAT superfamily N-acetyltransferase